MVYSCVSLATAFLAMSTPVNTLTTTNGKVDLYKVMEASTKTMHEKMHCQCPDCVHLEDGPPWGREQMDARGIVRIEDDGATKYVHRFPKGAEIYLCGPTNNAPGSVICAKCYAASKEADRAEWWRACVRKMYGSATDAGAQVDFCRVPLLEEMNDDFHDEGAKLAEIVERGNDDAQAQDVDEADAQRKANVKRRHAEVLVSKKTAASKEVDRANAEALLALYRNGCTVDPEGKEEDDTVDVGDEDGDEALKLYTEGEGDMNELRAQCPKYANRWLGRAPTEDDLAAQAGLVERLTSEAAAAKQKFEAVEGEVKALESQLVQDLEEEAFVEDAPKKGRGKGVKKNVEDMTYEEAVEYERKKRRDAATRKKSADNKRKMLGEYHELKAKADKAEEAQKQIGENKRKMETLKANAATWKRALDANEASSKERESHVAQIEEALAKKQRKLEKVQSTLESFKRHTLVWMGDPKDKPTGWNKKKMFDLYQDSIRDQKNADAEAAKKAANGANAGDANA